MFVAVPSLITNQTLCFEPCVMADASDRFHRHLCLHVFVCGHYMVQLGNASLDYVGKCQRVPYYPEQKV